MEDKKTTESWNILTSELDSVINGCVPMKMQEKRSMKKRLSKEALRKIIINKIRGGFINIRERTQFMTFNKRHETQQQMNFESKSDILSTNQHNI